MNHSNDYSDIKQPEDSIQRVFKDIEPYAVELLDEIRLIAKTRSAKAEASKSVEQRRQESMLSTVVYPGFDKITSWNCACEIQTIAKGIAERVGYGSDRVFQYGTIPPGGVFIDLKLDRQPVNDAIKIIDATVGSQIDLIVDPTRKTIVVEYLETSS